MGYDPDITKPSYAVIGLSGAITNERVLTGTTNKITITDGGAGGNVTFSTGSLVVHTDQANTYTGGGTQDFGSSLVTTTGNVQAGNLIAVTACLTSYTQTPGGRLTLLSLVSCASSDQTAKTTVYYTPDVSNEITFPNYLNLGIQYTQKFSEASLTVPSTTNTNYDVFAVPGPTATTITLAASAWSSDTLRVTEISRLSNGVWVSASNDRHLYLGSFRTTGVSGQTEDSAAKRYLYNAYNRRTRVLYCSDSTNSWTYSSSTYEEFRAQSTEGVSRVGVLCGLVEDAINCNLLANFTISTNSVRSGKVAIGLDSSTTPANGSVSSIVIIGTSSWRAFLSASYIGSPGIGYHTLRCLESSPSNNTTVTWYGDDGSTEPVSGLTGTFVC